VPVTWEEVDGSKLDVMSSTIQMARDIVAIRACYATGVWRTTPTPSQVEVTGKVPATAPVAPDASDVEPALALPGGTARRGGSASAAASSGGGSRRAGASRSPGRMATTPGAGARGK
jgi:hypothetical protein